MIKNNKQIRQIFGLFRSMSKPKVTILVYPEGEKVNLSSVSNIISTAKQNQTLLSKAIEENTELLT